MAGIVLAGGKSRRMGLDKASLVVGGDTLLQTVIARLAEVATPIYVAASPFRSCSVPVGVRVVHDVVQDAGPLAGIVTGLLAAGEGSHIVAACDMPFLNPAVLRLLLFRLQDHDAAVPVVNGRPEPTCAAYSGTALPRLQDCLAQELLALHRALDRLNVAYVPEEDLRQVDAELRCFTNINTPEELARVTSARHDGARAMPVDTCAQEGT